MRSTTTTSNTDIVSLHALHLATTVGPDGWRRIRPQPIALTVHLHLAPSFLDTPGQSDNVTDSVHYGHLAKAIQARVNAPTHTGYPNVRALAEDVTDAAFNAAHDTRPDAPSLLDTRIHAVRTVVALPKQILLAGGFEMDVVTRVQDWKGSVKTGAIVRVMDVILPVLIGVNPPERLSKQRVVTHLSFFEADRVCHSSAEGMGEMDYPTVVERIATEIENTSHLTLEKLVYQIICTAYRACDGYTQTNADTNPPQIDTITVHCQKPSALSFADASGVEMTRTREAILDVTASLDKISIN